MRRKYLLLAILAVPVCCLLAYGVYRLPPVYDRLAPRISGWYAEIKYALNPPEESIFIPESQVDAIVQATLKALTPSPTPTVPSATPTNPGPTFTLGPTFTPTITPTPLPETVNLTGVRHQFQRWNNCGPATLSMALSYWDWQGNQLTTADYLKPNERDKNVMPYEMSNYVLDETDLKMVIREGGEIELLKRLIAGGFPVIVEKGFSGAGFDDWMGHYELLSGYNQSQQMFIAQDSYRGPDYHISYKNVEFDWRAFNYIFLVAYPPEKEAELFDLLGPWGDEDWAVRHALEIAREEGQTLTGLSLYFAWFNVGTNHVSLLEYADAAAAYDFSFVLNANLPEGERAWRMMWYQTGPYKAYYYTQRYEEVTILAKNTLKVMSEPILEESYYWRGLAREALGDMEGAVSDFKASVRYNPHFCPGWAQLERLGENTSNMPAICQP